MLVSLAGWAGLVSAVAMFVILSTGLHVPTINKKIEKRIMKTADQLIGLLRQVLESIKPIKFMAWEDRYMETIDRVRAVEVRHV